MKQGKYRLLFLGLMAVDLCVIGLCVVFRFHGLGHLPGFGGDEAHLAALALQTGFVWNPLAHYHGPYLLLAYKAFFLLVSPSALTARLLPALANAAAILLFAFLAWSHWGRLLGNGAGARQGADARSRWLFVLGTTAYFSAFPLFFFYSRIALPHSFFPLFLVLALLFFDRALSDSQFAFLPVGLLLGLAFGLHPLPVLCVPAFVFAMVLVYRCKTEVLPFLGAGLLFLATASPSLRGVLQGSSESPGFYSPLSFLASLARIISGQQTCEYVLGAGYSGTELALIGLLLSGLVLGSVWFWVEHRRRAFASAHHWMLLLCLATLYLFTSKHRLVDLGHERYAIAALVLFPLVLAKALVGKPGRVLLFAALLAALSGIHTWGNLGRMLLPLEESGGVGEYSFRTGHEGDPRERVFREILDRVSPGSSAEILTWEYHLYWDLKFLSARTGNSCRIRMGYPREWEAMKDRPGEKRFILVYAETAERRSYFDALVFKFFGNDTVRKDVFTQANGEILLQLYELP